MSTTGLDFVQQQSLKIEWQRVLFADRLRRGDLLQLPAAPGSKALTINVHRNHSFEPVAAHLRNFLEYADWEPRFIYSDYDDSLGFQGYAGSDLDIVWLDFNRYSRSDTEKLLDWFNERIRALRELSRSPILIADWDDAVAGSVFNKGIGAMAGSIAGVQICSQSAIAERLGDAYLDARIASLTGTKLSGAACLETARFFGCRWIPPALVPRIKAIVTDLDNTLYEGVLGEDGPEGLTLRPEHTRLQNTLSQLRSDGIFLGIASRNESSDVQRLFEQRKDFPLRMTDFTASSIGWHSKSEGIRDVAAQLRIGIDAVLFVDDNPGELAQVSAELPGIRYIYAADPAGTVQALAWYPALAGYKKTETDAIRVSDLEAAQARAQQLAQAGNSESYIQALKMEIELALNPLQQIGRLHELSNKTNQFNTGLLRFSAAEVQRRLTEPDYAVVSIGLKDRLSDSGIVGSLFARRKGQSILIEEIAISCRALGRQVEDTMITEAIRGIAEAWDSEETRVDSVEFAFAEGPRNEPARTWITRYTGQSPQPGACVPMALNDCFTRPQLPVAVKWSEA